MYQVMIVDDEPLMREGLAGLIDWAALGCELAGRAERAEEALQLLETRAVDIVICDIKMPGQDGLTLGRLIQERGYAVKLIYLTAYSEFQYAQEAMRLGAVDYVIKSDYIESIPQAVEKAIAELERERKARVHVSQLEQALSARQALQQEQLLHSALTDIAPLTEQGAALLGLSQGRSYYLVVVDTGDPEAASKKRLTMLRDSLRALLTQALAGCRISLTGIDNGVVAVLVVPPDEAADIHVGLERLRGMVADALHMALSIGMSRQQTDPQALCAACQEADKAMRQQRFWGREAVQMYREEAAPAQALTTRMEALLVEAEHGSAQTLLAGFHRMLPLCEQADMPAETVKTFGVSLCSVYHIRHGVGLAQLGRFGEAYRAETAEAFERILASCFESDRAERVPYSALVEQVLRIIDAEYASALSVNQIAARLHVSSGHIGSLFHRETGQTITDALTLKRLETALMLLRDPNRKVLAIAQEVGFSDPAYFTNVFTRHMGMSPKAYRATINNEGG